MRLSVRDLMFGVLVAAALLQMHRLSGERLHPAYYGPATGKMRAGQCAHLVGEVEMPDGLGLVEAGTKCRVRDDAAQDEDDCDGDRHVEVELIGGKFGGHVLFVTRALLRNN